MKKSSFVVGMVYVLVGIVCLVCAVRVEDGLQGMLSGMGGAGIGMGGMLMVKYLRWKAHKDEPEFREKWEQEQIEQNDELTLTVRRQTAQIVHVVELVVGAVASLVFLILGELGILESGQFMGVFLCLFILGQLVLSEVIFRHKMAQY